MATYVLSFDLFHTNAPFLAVVRRPFTSSWLFVIYIAAILIGPMVLVGIVTSLRERRRTKALKEKAEQLGFEFLPAGDASYFAGLNALSLMATKGRQKKLFNLMRGKSASFEVTIFDYSYVTGSGRSARTWRQSPLCLQSSAIHLPDFALSPKNFWNKVGNLFGKHDIEFENDPDFSGKFVLRGSNAEAVRKVFTDEVRQFFDDHPTLNSQGAADRLLLYTAAKRCPPDQIPSLMENGLKLLSLIHSA